MQATTFNLSILLGLATRVTLIIHPFLALGICSTFYYYPWDIFKLYWYTFLLPQHVWRKPMTTNRLAVLLIFFIPIYSRSQILPVSNAGFEDDCQENIPQQWELGDRSSSVYDIRSNIAEPHGGKVCLEINHQEMARTTLSSKPIKLEVGHLYRLSGWLKAYDAFSDPSKRYPTPVAACLTMESFPFTNHSPAIGATKDWTKSQVLFIATKSEDRILLHFGFNGNAKGRILFDDIQLEKLNDISEYIPPETVKWCDKGFRYEDQGWIFLHIEGKPYPRGYQHGFLMADEIVAYMNKLAIEANKEKPEHGWNDLRFMADAMMLRKYDSEYLEEMKGMADGSVKAGAAFFDRNLDFLDIVTLNSYIDLDSARDALVRTPNSLSGKNYFTAEDELNIPEKNHKCSGFLANGTASSDGQIVFGQIFMWSGYTGPHWNVICDILPDKGNRLVYETYPGGIHSGADFYINSAGIMIGETTVWPQTPFNLDGTPQSFRIRKAAQYASSIDEVVEILSNQNNGMYSNDWLIGDAKTNETAIFLLGTKKSKLWRSSRKDFPGGTDGFYWSNNNAKDLEVRKEYVPNADNAPFDICFTPWNRDIAFNSFFQEYKGRIDSIAGVNLWNSAPINRPHACDGKITTSEMARKMVFLAHSGKVTLREKFVGENGRIPDLPGAEPRLTLGYTAFSPVYICDRIKANQPKVQPETPGKSPAEPSATPEKDFEAIHTALNFDERKLWHNTVYPASDKDNWFVSGTAMYWDILQGLPKDNDEEANTYLKDDFGKLNSRLQYVVSREGSLAPINARRDYEGFKFYQIPRIRGTFLLHQLKLLMGSDTFSTFMNSVHDKFREKPVSTDQISALANTFGGSEVNVFFNQWLERDDYPEIALQAAQTKTDEGWEITIQINQQNQPFHFFTDLKIECAEKHFSHLVEIKETNQEFTFRLKEKAEKIVLNDSGFVPMKTPEFYTMDSYYDDFHHTLVLYGTKRQIEANHTLALRFATLLADRVSEVLPHVKKEAETTQNELVNSDLMILGSTEDNLISESMAPLLAEKHGLILGKNFFTWKGQTFSQPDDGLFLALANPFNPQKFMFFFIANSAMQLYHMTNTYQSMPSWAVYKKGEITKKGYHTWSGLECRPVEPETSRILHSPGN